MRLLAWPQKENVALADTPEWACQYHSWIAIALECSRHSRKGSSMGTPAGRGWTMRSLAIEAGVLPKVARDAAAEGVLDREYLRETDIVLLRLYGALKRLVWPEEKRPANEDQGLRVWEAITIETARAALPDEVAPDTALFIHPAGCTAATGPGEYCQAMFELASGPFYFAPIGEWFEELPSRQVRDEQLPAA